MADRLGVRTGNTGQFQRTHRRTTPATKEEMAQAREAEKRRKAVDSYYIDAETVRSTPPEVIATDPELQSRIRYSQPEWPENRMSASEALGPLEGGAGEVTERRPMDAETEFFTPPERGE